MPEAQLGILPPSLAGTDSLELGCGTGYVSAWLARRGARLGTDSVGFHIGHGDMIRLLRRCGFEICDLIEVQPPPGSTTRHSIATLGWARKWPCEEVWKARKSP